MDIHETLGTIYLNDVGGDSWEEINDATEADKNLGWSEAEGFDNTNTYDNPIHAYSHTLRDENGASIFTDSTGNSIVGGAFLDKESNYPEEFHDKYFFL